MKNEIELQQQLKELSEREFKRANDPNVMSEFNKKISDVGHHILLLITYGKGEVQEFKVVDLDIIFRILNYIKFFNVDTQSLFYDTENKFSYLSAIIDFPNEIFNHATFDDYCIDLCKTLFLEKGLEFPNNDFDILISYPHTIEV